MNTLTRFQPCFLRLLLAVGLCLAAVFPARAENWQPLEIRLEAGRAAHAFALGIGGGEAFAVDNFGLYEGISPSLDHTFTWLYSGAVDLDQPLTLFDLTAGESAAVTLPATYGFPAMAYGPWVSPDGLARQYFLIPAARRGHALWLVADLGNVFFPVTQSDFLGVVDGLNVDWSNPAPRFEASASSPTAGFAILDETMGEMSEPPGTDLVTASWAQASVAGPAGALVVFVEGGQSRPSLHPARTGAGRGRSGAGVHAIAHACHGLMAAR